MTDIIKTPIALDAQRGNALCAALIRDDEEAVRLLWDEALTADGDRTFMLAAAIAHSYIHTLRAINGGEDAPVLLYLSAMTQALAATEGNDE